MFKRCVMAVIPILLWTGAYVWAQDSTSSSDPLAAAAVLEGVWQGTGEGFGQTSAVTHEWKRVVGGKFIRLNTRSVTEGAEGETSVHEDVGYISWNSDEDVFKFRQFLSEGFVNTFRLEPVESPQSGFNFEPESTEGAGETVARMTLRFEKPDVYEMILELGSRGQPLVACQTMKLTKSR